MLASALRGSTPLFVLTDSVACGAGCLIVCAQACGAAVCCGLGRWQACRACRAGCRRLIGSRAARAGPGVFAVWARRLAAPAPLAGEPLLFAPMRVLQRVVVLESVLVL